MLTGDEHAPASWDWPVTSAEHEALFQAAQARFPDEAVLGALKDWQAGRCAACGSTRGPLEHDHCHDTGAFRGMLCTYCNKQESHAPGDHPVFSRYRPRPPAVMLGVDIFWEHPDRAPKVSREALLKYRAATDPARKR